MNQPPTTVQLVPASRSSVMLTSAPRAHLTLSLKLAFIALVLPPPSMVEVISTQARAEATGLRACVWLILPAPVTHIQTNRSTLAVTKPRGSVDAMRKVGRLTANPNLLVPLEDGSGVAFDDGAGGTFHVFI